MSPLTMRRYRVFRDNSKVWIACWLWLIICLLGLGANLIANDKPWVVHYDGRYYFPLLFDYPETEFGGFLPTRADYSDPAVADLILANGSWLRAPIPFSYSSVDIALDTQAPSPPDRRHWLGTDDQGRDVLARVIYGVRLSLLFACGVSLGALVIGVAIGGVQGYFGGRIDLYGQRLIEIWSGMPVLFVLMMLSSVVVPNIGWLTLSMLLFAWLGLVDVVRAEFLRTRNLDYVAAAKLLGLSDALIIWRHVLPNAMVSTLTYLPFIFTGAIITLTSLDFLGFGLPPGAASLGELVNQARNNPQAPWLGITAFLTLAVVLSLMVLIGEGLRDAFDPRHVGRS